MASLQRSVLMRHAALVACLAALVAGCGACSAMDESAANDGCVTRTQALVRPRQPAPAFSGMAVLPAKPSTATAPAVDARFGRISLDDYRGRWLVLFFFPFAFTFVCPTEIVAFSDAAASFRDVGADIVGVSTDSHHTHLAWVKTPRSSGGVGGIQIPLIGDFSKTIAASFGVLVDDPTDDMYGSAMRALFIIDPKGVLRSVVINDDTVGRSVAEVHRLLTAFQFTAANDGMACPVNWAPGDSPIAASHDGAEEYFRAGNTNKVSSVSDPTDAFALSIALEDPIPGVKRVCIRIGMAHTLPSAYHLIQAEHVDITVISGGITNKLFRCDLNAAGQRVTGSDGPATVLVRWFGQNTEILIDRVREASVMTQLTEQGFGCPMIGAFANGRVEKFLQGYKALEPTDFHNAAVSASIARQLGHMHRLSVSGDRGPVVLRTLRKWMRLVRQVSFDNEEDTALLAKLNPAKLEEEVEWLVATAGDYPSPVVVAHNDLLPANVMRKGDDITLIDFEYSDWNTRGFDLANHFLEHAGFECEWATMLPSEAHKQAFYSAYLEAFYAGSHSGSELEAVVAREAKTLDREVSFYSLTSNMFWGLWGILQQAHSTIPFEYLPYSSRRVARYFDEKQRLLAA